MFRRGVVSALDPAAARAKVRWPDRAASESWWLQVGQPRGHGDRAYWMPDIGETVACLVDDRAEDGVILCALYSAAQPPPTADPDIRLTLHADGSQELFDLSRSLWQLAVPASGTIRLTVGASSITLTAAGVAIAGPRIDLN